MRKYLLASLFLSFLASLSFAQTRIPKGEIADHVQSAYDPSQTHAIYVPNSYTPEKKWPILFCYDARGRGRIPAELFQEGAERLGWIIFSSNHSRSDDPHFSNLVVLNAMWNDAHKWFSLDERRIYATGFSGGSRLAWGMGYIYPKSTAGVIGVGAGTHPERLPSKDTPFVWYGMCGRLDFNYLEMRKLDDQLHSLGIPSRTDFYEGPHNWPPDGTYCSRAMNWMELQAMKRERRPKDTAWLQEQFDSRMEEAKKAEASNVFDGFLKYKEIQEDFTGLLDTGDLSKKLAEFSNTSGVKNGLDERKKREEYEQKQLDKYMKILTHLRNASEIPAVRSVKADLELSKLQKEIKEKGASPEGMMYTRLLESISVQVAFYLPQYLLEKKDSERAITSLLVAAEIHADDPWIWYNMAVAQVQKGDKKKAIESLQMSIDRGLKNRKWIDEEKSFDVLKSDQQFQQVIAKLPPPDKS
jgi:tetratricopeptide (TPR) repeat protein